MKWFRLKFFIVGKLSQTYVFIYGTGNKNSSNTSEGVKGDKKYQSSTSLPLLRKTKVKQNKHFLFKYGRSTLFPNWKPSVLVCETSEKVI